VIASLTIVFFFFFYVAPVPRRRQDVFTLFGVSEKLGMLLTALIIIPNITRLPQRDLYDCVQAVLMIITLIVTPIAVDLYRQHTRLFVIPSRALKPWTKLSFSTGASSDSPPAYDHGAFSWFFGYLGGQPQLSMRFMHSQPGQTAKRGTRICPHRLRGAIDGSVSNVRPRTLRQEHVLPWYCCALPRHCRPADHRRHRRMVSTADSLLVLSASTCGESGKAAVEEKRPGPLSQALRLITPSWRRRPALPTVPQPAHLYVVGYVWAASAAPSPSSSFTLFWKRYHAVP